MATGGLLHHHHHPRLRRPPLHLVESHHLLYRRPPMYRLLFPSKRFSLTPSKLGLLQPTQRSIQCVKQEEAMAWVNKAPHDPMVEVDPVTVFRRIVTERRARLAMARAKEEQANLALQPNSPPPVILGVKWPGRPAIAIIAALVLLAVAAALYFLRSRKGSADAEDSVDSSVNGRRMLVKDAIKAPESVLTAMALGAASVGRPKVHTGSGHDILRPSNGNVAESQSPIASTDFYPIANTIAVDDMKSDLHGKPMFGQMPYSSSTVEDFTPLDAENVGVDVAEGPWFGHSVTDTEVLAPTAVQELASEKPEEPKADVGLFKSQALPISTETAALPAEELLSNSMQGLEFKSEELLIDDATAEKLEKVIEEGLITPLEGKHVADDIVCPEQNIVIGSSAPDFSNGKLDETDSESDDEDDDSATHHGVEQSCTLNEDDGVMSLEASLREDGFEVSEGHSLSRKSDSISTNEQENITNMPSGVNETLEGIETKPDEVLGGVSSSADTFQVEEDEGFVCDSRTEKSMDNSAAVRVSEEDSREESKKALEAALPAIAIGVGTVGALLGVAGGLQVVGFAALASLLSRDFLWAQSRESLRRELNGITDRQKLLDFLAKRNIMRTELEN